MQIDFYTINSSSFLGIYRALEFWHIVKTLTCLFMLLIYSTYDITEAASII